MKEDLPLGICLKEPESALGTAKGQTLQAARTAHAKALGQKCLVQSDSVGSQCHPTGLRVKKGMGDIIILLS